MNSLPTATQMDGCNIAGSATYQQQKIQDWHLLTIYIYSSFELIVKVSPEHPTITWSNALQW